MAPPLRFLLDNNFPEVDAQLDPHQVDRTVVFEHIRDWRPDLIEAATPDWLIYFEAELAGFAGMVTHDRRQTDQAEEAFAITRTKLVVVTWRVPPEDPIVSWALVIAYMPEIKRILAARRDAPFIFLPSPKLGAERNLQKAKDALGNTAHQLGISVDEVKRRAREAILDYLRRENLRDELVDLVQNGSRRWPPGSKLAARRARSERPAPGASSATRPSTSPGSGARPSLPLGP